MSSDRRDIRDASLCALLLCAVAIATKPWAEVGIDDDWSFTHTALDLARTGRLLYYNWSEPIIGFQAYWAALLIRLFGFSFTLVRFSTLPFAMGSAALLYCLSRYAGLARAPSFLATLSVMLSPLMIPLSVSFMTEMPAFFFLLAVVYSGLRALDREDSRGCLLWLTVSAIAGFLGGTVRQTDWGLPLLMIPAIAYLRRRERSVVLASAGLWAGLIVAAGASIQWFRAQPYMLDHTNRLSFADLREHPARSFMIVVLSLFLYILPAWAGYLYFLPRMLRRWRLLIFGATVFAALCMANLARAPWAGNVVTHWGILDATTDILGDKPRLLPFVLERALAYITFVGFSISVALLLDRLLSRRAPGSRSGPDDTHLFRLAALTLPFAVAYLFLIMVRCGVEPYDRYLVVLMPIVSIALLLQFQKCVGEGIPAISWLALSIFAVYGICTTHDALSMRRAIVRAAGAIIASGVPRHCISGGFEFDGWTQIEEGRFVGYQKPVPHKLPVHYWFWDEAPKVDPHFILVLSPMPGLENSSFPPVSYTGWLPPGERKVWTQIGVAGDCRAPANSGR